MSEINQKEYLKKYLSDETDKIKKKKRKKKLKATPSRVKIIDDDADYQIFNEAVQEDLLGMAEDAPQIVGIIDERPIELRLDDFKTEGVWKTITIDGSSDSEQEQFAKRKSKSNPQGTTRELDHNKSRRRNSNSESDNSPPRKSERHKNEGGAAMVEIKIERETPSPENVDSDASPPRKRRNHSASSPPRQKYKENQLEIKPEKSSPIRRNRNEDNSPPRKNRKLDNSPLQRNRNEDYSPPRRNRNQDNGPPRKTRNEDISSHRRNRNEDYSPPRKNRNEDSSSHSRHRNEDNSPPRRIKDDKYVYKKKKDEDKSPSRRKKDHSPTTRKRTDDFRNVRRTRDKNESPPRSKRYEDYNQKRNENIHIRDRSRDRNNSPSVRIKIEKDASPPRRKTGTGINSRTFQKYSPSKHKGGDFSPPNRCTSPKRNNKKSRWGDASTSTQSNAKMTKTLDGKTAGLQNAKDLISETQTIKNRENDIFNNMSAEVSGVNAATIVRDRKTGKIRDLNKEAADLQLKQKEQAAIKEKYDKWGKGTKQVEDYNEKLQQDIHEMNKPLARYADDEDLERYLKEQEREGDPMLAYIRKKKRKDLVESGKPLKPQYEGEFMPNRFGIRPGHKWDGVDRSNGYEKKWFEVQNAKQAQKEEIYRWNSEDM